MEFIGGFYYRYILQISESFLRTLKFFLYKPVLAGATITKP